MTGMAMVVAGQMATIDARMPYGEMANAAAHFDRGNARTRARVGAKAPGGG